MFICIIIFVYLIDSDVITTVRESSYLGRSTNTTKGGGILIYQIQNVILIAMYINHSSSLSHIYHLYIMKFILIHTHSLTHSLIHCVLCIVSHYREENVLNSLID
jgi:hypothetical protein